MEFEWDEAKNRQNIEKHAISFEDACKIFNGFTVDAYDDRLDYGEERLISVGMVETVVILTVVHTDRKGVCRIISARQANRKEKEQYDKALRQALNT